MSLHHEYCRGRLKMARDYGKEVGIKVPVISSTEMFPESYAVFLGDHFYEEYNSCCAYEARASAIYEYIDGELEG